MNIPCISFGQFIVSLIVLIVVCGLLSRVSAGVASAIGAIFPSLLFIWWLSGFFRDCDSVKRLAYQKEQGPQSPGDYGM